MLYLTFISYYCQDYNCQTLVLTVVCVGSIRGEGAGDNMSTRQRDGRARKDTILTAVLGTIIERVVITEKF